MRYPKTERRRTTKHSALPRFQSIRVLLYTRLFVHVKERQKHNYEQLFFISNVIFLSWRNPSPEKSNQRRRSLIFSFTDKASTYLWVVKDGYPGKISIIFTILFFLSWTPNMLLYLITSQFRFSIKLQQNEAVLNGHID